MLAASLSFNLEIPPCGLIERRYRSAAQEYDRSGSVFTREAPDLWNVILALGFGEGGVEVLREAVPAGAGAPIRVAEAAGPESAPPEYRDRLWWRANLLKDSRSVDKKLLGWTTAALIVLTGFLGSGKTSFLQHFIEYRPSAAASWPLSRTRSARSASTASCWTTP